MLRREQVREVLARLHLLDLPNVSTSTVDVFRRLTVGVRNLVSAAIAALSPAGVRLGAMFRMLYRTSAKVGQQATGLDRLRLPTRREIITLLNGVFLGLVIGLTLLMAVALLPGLFGYYPLVVLSGSMEPTLHVGDIAVIREVEPYDLQLGDVVTYATVSGRVTHRIVGLDVTPQGPFFLTRGDANPAQDPRPIPAERIVGKVMYRIPRLGFLVSFTDSAVGRFLFIGAPLLILAGMFLRRRARVARPGGPD